MREFFIKGGPVMWPLLICSILSLAVTFERARFWWQVNRRNDGTLLDSIFERVEQGDHQGAVARGAGIKGIEGRMLMTGLANHDHGLKESMEAEAVGQIERMNKGMNILDTIITMAPLLGILGTVLGIIESFDLLSLSGIQDPKAVIGGISQALITTASGLTVALVTLIPFNYYSVRVQRATRRLEKTGTRFELAYLKGLASRAA
jgi:biopolymer transport protein ExbB